MYDTEENDTDESNMLVSTSVTNNKQKVLNSSVNLTIITKLILTASEEGKSLNYILSKKDIDETDADVWITDTTTPVLYHKINSVTVTIPDTIEEGLQKVSGKKKSNQRDL